LTKNYRQQQHSIGCLLKGQKHTAPVQNCFINFIQSLPKLCSTKRAAQEVPNYKEREREAKRKRVCYKIYLATLYCETFAPAEQYNKSSIVIFPAFYIKYIS